MEFFDLVNISEQFMELVNPISPEKVMKVGEVSGLNQDSRVIEFGSGYGEVLALWAEAFGISGIGIEIRDYACQRATKKMQERGFANRIKIVCANAAGHEFEKHAFDVAACVGATFIWDGFRSTIRAMREAVRPAGKLVIGEQYWQTDRVPSKYAKEEKAMLTELELLQIIRDEGYDLEYVARATHDEWDRYVTQDWHGLLRWIEENTNHPEREEVIRHFHMMQDKYVKYDREHMGWAMYVLKPIAY